MSSIICFCSDFVEEWEKYLGNRTHSHMNRKWHPNTILFGGPIGMGLELDKGFELKKYCYRGKKKLHSYTTASWPNGALGKKKYRLSDKSRNSHQK
jgi:hypothetical protein